MTADVWSASPSATPERHEGAGRIALAVFGVAAIVIGIVLLANPVAAARTLAFLLGISLVVAGGLEIALGWDTRHRWLTAVLGAVLVVGGLLAAFWPDVTLWTLAVLTGISLIVHGIGRVAVALLERAAIPGWGWLVLAGFLNAAIGVIVLAWPEATVLVLCLLLGAQVLVFGLLALISAFARPRSAARAA